MRTHRCALRKTHHVLAHDCHDGFGGETGSRPVPGSRIGGSIALARHGPGVGVVFTRYVSLAIG
ncbi:MAG: hypothetical protein OXC42_03105 [Gammaproteobacteria bacterium]|nr:hypothetical protein [Gammaproteobacteria bacterium]